MSKKSSKMLFGVQGESDDDMVYSDEEEPEEEEEDEDEDEQIQAEELDEDSENEESFSASKKSQKQQKDIRKKIKLTEENEDDEEYRHEDDDDEDSDFEDKDELLEDEEDKDEDEDEDAEEDEEDEDEDNEEYKKYFKEQLTKDYIANVHPECIPVNMEEVEALLDVIRDEDGNIVDDFHKTIPFITKYEKARIIGQRASQLNAGAEPYIMLEPNVIDASVIAEMEFERKKIPAIIKRPLPNGAFEYWKLSDLEVLI